MLEVAVLNPPLDLCQLFSPLFWVIFEERSGLLSSLLKCAMVKGFIHNMADSYRRHFYGRKQIHFPFPNTKGPVSLHTQKHRAIIAHFQLASARSGTNWTAFTISMNCWA